MIISPCPSTHLNFDPVRLCRCQSPVEGDSLVNDGRCRVDAHQVQHGAAQGVLLSDVSGQVNVSPPDVLFHQPSQIIGINIV